MGASSDATDKRFLAGRESDGQPSPTYTEHYADAHYFYDGSRRIQEVFVYPDETAEFLWGTNDLPLTCIDDVYNADGDSDTEDCLYVVEHEYVYGPDYIDEFICQITADDTYGFDNDDPTPGAGVDDVYYYLQDANHNLMAVVGANADVLVQMQYDPYTGNRISNLHRNPLFQ